jgi:aspartyl-tRNA(Asn)/glutamyl-tRNA(Gln) amidotransferase subunit C
MAKLTRDDVLKLAHLARIEIDESEIDRYQTELNEILKYVEQLQNVDVDDLLPTDQVTGLTNVSREDKVIDYGYKPADLLKNVPAVVDNQIKVKRIL